MKFYLDENMSPKIAEILRSLGVEAASAHEVDMAGAADEEQLDFAARQGHVPRHVQPERFHRTVETISGRWSAALGGCHSALHVQGRQFQADSRGARGLRLPVRKRVAALCSGISVACIDEPPAPFDTREDTRVAIKTIYWYGGMFFGKTIESK